MADTAQDTIREAAEAYLEGDQDRFYEQLHENAHVIGSEQRDVWSDREEAVRQLSRELERRRAPGGGVRGSLIDEVTACEGVLESGNLATWSGTGDLELDGYYHRKASWTVVVARSDEKETGNWEIVHSHFSIHR